MPIIQRNFLTIDDFEPKLPWRDDTTVQWGGCGIVLGKNPYRTAFFEAFPKAGGFIRGEGETIEQAERQAFDEWSRSERCAADGGHRWSRVRRHNGKPIDTYTNGGCFCIRCGTFATKMKPIRKLGAWRDPLSVMDLEAISFGLKIKDAYTKKLRLKAKIAGIDLPDETDPYYMERCRIAVGKYWSEHHHEIVITASQSLTGFFEDMAVRYLNSFS